ncbi:MAG: proline--tRNA ligase [Deltaproteobacteria bacterium]|jgi:prolyl-tRNA synthetase|nr:proline--tRNA ligase [Deltaproteobacteria bacterium]
MLWSSFYLPTLKEAPAEAEVVSHRLMLRAGMIRKLTSGVYAYMPYGNMAINKVADIVRQEMNRAGAVELSLPMVQPADLWRESGRWVHYGKELLRFKDRHERECCLGPTHEEVIVSILRGELRSYRQLPLNLYQIQTKFRDEIRPRFGLLRGREFIMKDAYSFDRDDEGAERSYKAMYDAYARIFTRLGLRFRAVEADSGSIGGKFSHEFMLLANTGEDTIAVCSACDYATNLERAAVTPRGGKNSLPPPPLEEISTPGVKSIEELCLFLDVPPDRTLKTMFFDVDGKVVAVLVRGDRVVNGIKVKNYFDAALAELLPPEKMAEIGAPAGFAGPLNLAADYILADHELEEGGGWIAGAGKTGFHVKNLDLERDARVSAYADLRLLTAEDPCPRCGASLELTRGIEVGHTFKLGVKYSAAMKAYFLDENSLERPLVMGCYGIGVTRVVAACIEQNHDADGIIFPPAIAPFAVEILNLDPKSGKVTEKALEIYDIIRGSKLDVLLDDREERPGVKFKDADLLGSPMQVIIGARGLERGIVEVKNRRSGAKAELSAVNFAAGFELWKDRLLEEWSPRPSV